MKKGNIQNIWRILTIPDKILIGVLLVLGLSSPLLVSAFKPAGKVVVIEVNNRIIGRFPLDVPRSLKVKGTLGTSIIEIKDSKAYFERSPCQNKVCIKAGKIDQSGHMAVCLPNRILVRIEGSSEDNLPDGVSR